MARTLETTKRAAQAETLARLENERSNWVAFAWDGRELWFRKKAITAITPSSEDPALTAIWLWGADEPFVTDESLSAVLQKLGLEEKKENER